MHVQVHASLRAGAGRPEVDTKYLPFKLSPDFHTCTVFPHPHTTNTHYVFFIFFQRAKLRDRLSVPAAALHGNTSLLKHSDEWMDPFRSDSPKCENDKRLWP